MTVDSGTIEVEALQVEDCASDASSSSRSDTSLLLLLPDEVLVAASSSSSSASRGTREMPGAADNPAVALIKSSTVGTVDDATSRFSTSRVTKVRKGTEVPIVPNASRFWTESAVAEARVWSSMMLVMALRSRFQIPQKGPMGCCVVLRTAPGVVFGTAAAWLRVRTAAANVVRRTNILAGLISDDVAVGQKQRLLLVSAWHKEAAFYSNLCASAMGCWGNRPTETM
ncbi:unnamed protein product [Ixodes pacificus]